MPFVYVRWRRGAVDEITLLRLRDALGVSVGVVLSKVDPDHVVNDQMVDIRFEEIGPLDRIRGDLFVTVLARDEAARRAGSESVVAAIYGEVRRISPGCASLVELVLTTHTSSFDYGSLE